MMLQRGGQAPYRWSRRRPIRCADVPGPLAGTLTVAVALVAAFASGFFVAGRVVVLVIFSILLAADWNHSWAGCVPGRAWVAG